MSHHQYINTLMEMIQNIALNAGYRRYIQDYHILVDYAMYFDICQIIFPQFKIKLIKIQEEKNTNPPQKMQSLINMLSKELRIDLSEIQGSEILRLNCDHLYKFLSLLNQYSKVYMESVRPRYGVRSQSSRERQKQDEFEKPAGSARDPKPKRYYDDSDSNLTPPPQPEHQPEPQKKSPKVQKNKKKAKEASQSRKLREHQQNTYNLHHSVVNTVINQKSKMVRASFRDNRKHSLQDITNAKHKYSHYLKNYKKENVASINRQSYLDAKKGENKSLKELPISDFNNIDNFFASFAYKLRDQKYSYLKKIQRLVQKQQIDKFCYKNKIERETKAKLQNQLKSQIISQQHQHDVQVKLLKQKAKAVQDTISIMKKQYKKKTIEQKKQLKLAKKKQIEKIQNFLKQDNEKVLMTLEEGGRLEKIIMQMYKRF